jgi:hypothetical protein
VQVSLTWAAGGRQVTRTLLADSGAGTARSGFDLLLRRTDGVSCGGILLHNVILGRAYAGPHPVYLLRVQTSGLGFNQALRVVGITSPPAGCDGTACFAFLNQFTYGNFGYPNQFGLEC